ncbi:unnamed protein product [Mytilus edulis]|uniref:Uncharacterized protein n=1 Tax=Mytilus edulis TaxID=6550 RepID=A0A8S3Q6R9_MYTED|nr:unnamed protein product [Mytilus edulis]
MYGCFDTLLNLLNKNYIGLLQDINSQELAMNYRSISTVFSFTSTSGATLSLNESEQRLKEKARSDLCYYNTYLKKHAIAYETVAGLIKKELSIRDCILILMMDNLVRLKYHNDPDPGESRSMQICTLPITVKGMPKDALIVESWHDEQVCDGTDSCVCKEDEQLTKEDLEDLVLTLSPVEVEVKNRFQQLMTWGYAKFLTEAFDIQTVENPDTTLETSFASLKVVDEDDTLPLYADEMALSNDLDQLNEMENENFLGASSLEKPASELHETDFGLFMEKGKADNATFALHGDMMDHSDEVCAIAFAERLGGDPGYNLLLSAVKTSLPFSFLNGASSYAAYCSKLLHEHFKSGPFYRRMKTTLFTTPHKGSNVNFALDSQREMDHQDVIKAFRSGATVTSVIPRMSLIDTLNEVHDLTVKNTSGHNISTQEKSQEELLGIVMSELI